jgi:prepilin-type N-terminal cleavage/methylation domain-containing protein
MGKNKIDLLKVKILYHGLLWNSLAFYDSLIHNVFMPKYSSKKGFTLIELIIVISIIGLLSVIGISSFSAIQEDARNAKRKGDLKEMQKALEAFKTRNGRYPDTCTAANTISCDISASNWRGTCTTYNNSATVNDTGASGYIPDLAPEFIPVLPHEPREDVANPSRSGGSSTANGLCAIAGRSCYIYRSNGSDYKLLSHCSPEGDMSNEDPFYDPTRESVSGGVTYRWAWQVSSSSVSRAW